MVLRDTLWTLGRPFPTSVAAMTAPSTILLPSSTLEPQTNIKAPGPPPASHYAPG
jgi:hypothetical protein